MGRLRQRDRRDAQLSWAATVVSLAVAGWSVLQGEIGWALFAAGFVAVAVSPPLVFRSSHTVMPWEPVAVASGAILLRAVVEGPLQTPATYAAVAAVALVGAVGFHTFTAVQMNRGFAVAFVVMATLTTAGVWELLRWGVDLVAGTSMVESNDEVMRSLVYAAGVGTIAGVVFERYFRRLPADDFLPDGFAVDDTDDEVEAGGAAVSDFLASLGLDDDHQRLLVRGMQLTLAGVIAAGVLTGQLSVVVNGTVGLGLTLLPALFERDLDIRMDVGLTLWITTAVFLHSLGSLWFYGDVGAYHNLTHAVSATVVAGAGYATMRAVETHARGVSFPRRFTFLLVVLFVFSFGVLWEILEFSLDRAAATLGREELVLAQHGLRDTMTDLVFDTLGAVVVAAAAAGYLRR